MGLLTSPQLAKWATLLETCTKEECSGICLLGYGGNRPIEIHCSMKLQYHNTSLSVQQVCEWSRKFKNGVCGVS